MSATDTLKQLEAAQEIANIVQKQKEKLRAEAADYVAPIGELRNDNGVTIQTRVLSGNFIHDNPIGNLLRIEAAIAHYDKRAVIVKNVCIDDMRTDNIRKAMFTTLEREIAEELTKFFMDDILKDMSQGMIKETADYLNRR